MCSSMNERICSSSRSTWGDGEKSIAEKLPADRHRGRGGLTRYGERSRVGRDEDLEAAAGGGGKVDRVRRRAGGGRGACRLHPPAAARPGATALSGPGLQQRKHHP